MEIVGAEGIRGRKGLKIDNLRGVGSVLVFWVLGVLLLALLLLLLLLELLVCSLVVAGVSVGCSLVVVLLLLALVLFVGAGRGLRVMLGFCPILAVGVAPRNGVCTSHASFEVGYDDVGVGVVVVDDEADVAVAGDEGGDGVDDKERGAMGVEGDSDVDD